MTDSFTSQGISIINEGHCSGSKKELLLSLQTTAYPFPCWDGFLVFNPSIQHLKILTDIICETVPLITLKCSML